MCLDNKEFCDVWTDIHCNYGHLLIDRSRMCLDHTEFLRRVDRRNGHLLTDSLKRSITPAGHRAAARGGTRIIPAPSFTQHSLLNAAIWPELNRQPLNHEAVPLPLSHRSHVESCAGTYISLFTSDSTIKQLKALAVSLYSDWLESNQQPLNCEAVLLPVSHRSLVSADEGPYI